MACLSKQWLTLFIEYNTHIWLFSPSFYCAVTVVLCFLFGQWIVCHLSLLLVALELLLNPSIDFAGRHSLLAHDVVCNDWRRLMTEFIVHDVKPQSSVGTMRPRLVWTVVIALCRNTQLLTYLISLCVTCMTGQTVTVTTRLATQRRKSFKISCQVLLLNWFNFTLSSMSENKLV